jgi:cytochrome c peroxidase
MTRVSLALLSLALTANTADRFPPQPWPANNPPSAARAELGRYLFYDKRLSVNGKSSCSTCHRQELAFTDGKPRAQGATGEFHPRNAPSLVNLAWSTVFNWSDPTVHSLEAQVLKPMFSTSPIELGYSSVEGQFLNLARRDPTYVRLFTAAFPDESDQYTTSHVAAALAAFERTIVSGDSPWDRFHFDGDQNAISESAKRGEILFFLDGGPSCFRCHSGFNFTDSKFHNTALYDPYPSSNAGLAEFTRRPADSGMFRTPGLRNVALTAPYMHDGSMENLEEVIDHYAAAGRARTNPNKDPLIRGFRLTARNRADLVAFLQSLTDDSLLHDPRFSNPWPVTVPLP